MRKVDTISISITATGTTYTQSIGVHDTAEKINVLLNVTASGGTSPTLDVTPQWSTDDGTTWFDAEDESATSLALAQVTGVTKKQKTLDAVATAIRFKLVAGGTSPTFTATLAVVQRGGA